MKAGKMSERTLMQVQYQKSFSDPLSGVGCRQQQVATPLGARSETLVLFPELFTLLPEAFSPPPNYESHPRRIYIIFVGVFRAWIATATT